MKSLKWMLSGAVALLFTAAPALAAKEIVVDYETARVYPLEDGWPARSPLRANNRSEFAWKDIGTFRISEKVADKRSNMYNVDGDPIRPGDKGAVMRYWMRLGGSAQGFHLSSLYQAEGSPHRSHGCYRLSRAGATWLFDWTPIGTPVHVVRSLKESRFAYLLDPQRPVVAARLPRPSAAPARSSSPRPAAIVKAASAQATATKPAPRGAATVKPAPRAAVTIRPAPKAAATRVTVRRVVEPEG